MTVHNAASFVSRVGVFELDDARGTMYAQIAETLTSAITSGRLLPGDKLPAERHLATELGVSRDTIRQALSELQRHGHLVRTVGRTGGTFVAEPKVRRDLSRCAAPADRAPGRRAEDGARVLSARERHVGPAITAALEIEPGAYVYEIVRIRLAEGRPIALEHAYYPAKRLPGLLDHPLDGSVHALLREVYREVPVRAIEYLEPILAGPEEVEALEVEEGTPLMYVERIVLDGAGGPVEFSRDIFRGDRTRMVVWGSDDHEVRSKRYADH